MFLYTSIPIFITPGNSLSLFLQITPWWALILIGALALCMGLLISMQIYLWKNVQNLAFHEVSTGLGAGLSSFISGLFSSATCVTCISTLFSFFLPPAGVLLLFDYRWWITGIGLLSVLLSLFLTSRRMMDKCQSCNTPLGTPERTKLLTAVTKKDKTRTKEDTAQ